MNADTPHYEQTRAFHDDAARTRQGYYDWKPGQAGAPRHSCWQVRTRAMVIEALRAATADHVPETVLDVGCGRGDFTRRLKAEFPAARVLGVDFSEPMLDLARQQAPPGLAFRQAGLPDLALDGGSFDIVVCLNVFHHVLADDQEEALTSLCRLARMAVILEIKNARCPYKWLPRSLWLDAETRVYPTTARRVAAVAEANGFCLDARRGLFRLDVLSPIMVLTLVREGT
ncbi:MAG: class I SAM-dependent methyltransferase [Lentisphaerae bacterium]|nr:class I SAM-dependent methyltransferase [Lentisphaerota bacterium]